MTTIKVLIIVMILVFDFLVTFWRELGQPIFLEGISGLTHMKLVQALPKITTVAPKAGPKKGTDIGTEQLAAHVKAMSFIKK